MNKDAWFYLLQRHEGEKGEQQFGITNVLSQRLATHARYGWRDIKTTGPLLGKEVLETEKKLKKWLKKK